MSHVYGETLERQNKLRMHKDGKLKFSIKNGEVFPPTVDDADVPMIAINKVDKEYRFAIGHRSFTVLPPLLFFATIWLRLVFVKKLGGGGMVSFSSPWLRQQIYFAILQN